MIAAIQTIAIGLGFLFLMMFATGKSDSVKQIKLDMALIAGAGACMIVGMPHAAVWLVAATAAVILFKAYQLNTLRRSRHGLE